MSYPLVTLWHERQRYWPGVMAVAFSAILIATQCGVLLGLLAICSLPVDRTHADIWIGSQNVTSVDMGQPIPMSYLSRLANDPDVKADSIEVFIQRFAQWKKPKGDGPDRPADAAPTVDDGKAKAKGGSELCIVIAGSLEDGTMGAVDALSSELRNLLTEPGAVVVDRAELDRLGLTTGVGETAEILGRRVRVVGLVRGYKSLAGPYVFCSLPTAREIFRGQLRGDQTVYLLGRCGDPERAPEVAARLARRYKDDMAVYTKAEFSLLSRMHWLFKTQAGIVIGVTTVLGLLVGAVVTSQTLYAATVASQREYAILRALGVPRWRMSLAVLTQSFWVGLLGILVAGPIVFGLDRLAQVFAIRVELPWWLIGGVAGLTLVMAMASGFVALRSLRQVEPATLLR